MSDEKNVRQFVREFLPQELSREIKVDNLKMLPTEKIKRYTRYHMDLAIECEIGETKGQIYFIFEHKSYPDAGVLFQCLSYVSVIWDEEMRHNQPLIPIIPVVIYHGAQNWNIPLNFQGQFSDLKETIKPYLPEFKYSLVDLTRLSDDEIKEKAKGNLFLAASLQLMKYIPRQDVSSIMGISDIILLSKRDKLTLFWYMTYGLDIELETMERVIKQLGGEDVMPSLAERLKNRGEIEGKQKILIKLLHCKFGLTSEEEERIRSVNDAAKLDAAAGAILDAKLKSEVLKLLE